MIDMPRGAVCPFRSSSVDAVIFVQYLFDVLFAGIPDCSSTTLEEQYFCFRLDGPDTAGIFPNFPLSIVCIPSAGVMQSVISKIMTCFDGCNPIGLVIDEVKT